MNNDARRATFVTAAQELFEERGIAKTSIGDIAKRAGVTRSLFYHYFADKDALIDAVIDQRVDDFVDRVTKWNQQYDDTRSRDSMREIVPLIKAYLLKSRSLTDNHLHKENAALRQRFTIRSADRLARRFERNSDLAKSTGDGCHVYHTHVTYPYETYYVTAVGLMSLLNRDPNVDEDIIVDLIVGALHLEG